MLSSLCKKSKEEVSISKNAESFLDIFDQKAMKKKKKIDFVYQHNQKKYFFHIQIYTQSIRAK